MDSLGHVVRLVSAAAMTLVVVISVAAQQVPSTAGPLHRPFDQFLDIHVRDGLVYYGAVKAERSRLDRYVASLDVSAETYGAWSREQQLAFWLNAYNAIVIQSVANNYPIRGKAS